MLTDQVPWSNVTDIRHKIPYTHHELLKYLFVPLFKNQIKNNTKLDIYNTNSKTKKQDDLKTKWLRKKGYVWLGASKCSSSVRLLKINGVYIT